MLKNNLFSEKNNMYSVMGNQGFSDVIIMHNGLICQIPQSLVSKTGLVRKDVVELIRGLDPNILSLADMKKLQELGVVIHFN